MVEQIAAALAPGPAGGADPSRPQAKSVQQSDAALQSAAKALEAAFLAEMLKHSGVGETPEAFGGGAGEDQFASFMRAEQARSIVDKGGIGLAEFIFNAMKEVRDADGS